MTAPAAPLARNGSFRAFWLGQLVSIFGDRLHYLALLALIVERAHDPGNPALELALVPAVSFLPAILFGPLAGALVDSWDTRRVLVVSDAIRGFLVLLMIPAASSGGLPLAFGIVFLLYVANTFFLPARSAIVPDLVREEELVQANSLATLAGVLATIVGSFLGGLLVERMGWRWGLGIDAVTYFVSVLFLASMKPAARARTRPVGHTGVYRRLQRDIQDGARVAIQNRVVTGALLALVCLWVAGGALHVAGTLLVERRAPGFVSAMGGILSLLGFGMVAGTVLLTTRVRRVPRRVLTAAGLSGTGLMIWLFARTSGFWALAGIAFVAGVFVALLLVTTEAAIQSSVEPQARGRVFALRDFSTRLAVLAVAGVLGLSIGRKWIAPESTVAGAGALLAVAGVLGYLRWNRPGGAAGGRHGPVDASG